MDLKALEDSFGLFHYQSSVELVQGEIGKVITVSTVLVSTVLSQ